MCKKTYRTERLTYNKIEGGYEVSGVGSAEAYTVTIPSTYEGEPVIGIGSSSFANCRALVSVEIPDSVTSIGDSAFYNCRSLISVKIPNSVKSIGSASFQYCRSMERIKIPNGVTSIGAEAFKSCVRLKSVKIPYSLTSVGEFAFYYCDSLESIEYGGKKDEWKDRITKEKGWNWSTGNYTVKCSDGTLTNAESES